MPGQRHRLNRVMRVRSRQRKNEVGASLLRWRIQGAVSNYELGMAYALGNTLEQDYAKAFEHFTRSARGGLCPGPVPVGRRPMPTGDGTEKDPARAVEWYEKSAVQGHTEGPTQPGADLSQRPGRTFPGTKPLALALYIPAGGGRQPDGISIGRDTLLQELSEQEISMAQETTAGIRKRLESGD